MEREQILMSMRQYADMGMGGAGKEEIADDQGETRLVAGRLGSWVRCMGKVENELGPLPLSSHPTYCHHL